MSYQIWRDELRFRIGVMVTCFLMLAMLALAVFKHEGLLDVWEREKKLATIQADITRIEVENKKLVEEIHALRTDPNAIEKIAREKLKLVKPGEIVIVTPGESK